MISGELRALGAGYMGFDLVKGDVVGGLLVFHRGLRCSLGVESEVVSQTRCDWWLCMRRSWVRYDKAD